MTEGRWAEVVVRLAVFSTGMFSSKYPENVSLRWVWTALDRLLIVVYLTPDHLVQLGRSGHGWSNPQPRYEDHDRSTHLASPRILGISSSDDGEDGRPGPHTGGTRSARPRRSIDA